MGTTHSHSHKQRSIYVPQSSVECIICCRPISEKENFELGCFKNHQNQKIHKYCVVDYVSSSIRQGNSSINCCFWNCGLALSTSDIEKLATPELFQAYLNLCLQKYLKTTPDILKCPDAACSYAFISSEPSCSEFNCINCNKKYCLSCKQPSHEGQCVFEKLFASLNYRQMQKMWAEQDGGCKYVTCRCGFQFCISCGMKGGKCGC